MYLKIIWIYLKKIEQVKVFKAQFIGEKRSGIIRFSMD